MSEWYLESIARDIDLTGTYSLKDFKEYKIGRKKDLDIVSFNPLVSRFHGTITVEDYDTVFIKDINSSNGIWVNDEKITTNLKHLLKVNDLIGIGAPSNAAEDKLELYNLRRKSISDVSNSVGAASDTSACNNPSISLPAETTEHENEQHNSPKIVEDIIPCPNHSEKRKNNNNSFSKEVLVEVNDSNDEMFPASQLFNDIKSEMPPPEETPDSRCINKIFNTNNSFDMIKKEVDINDNDQLEIKVSDDDDCEIWFNKLSQSQNEINADITEPKHDKEYIYKTDVCKEIVQISRVTDDITEHDELDEIRNFVNNTTIQKEIFNKSVPSTSTSVSVINEHISNLPEQFSNYSLKEPTTKTGYIKPPIIDAPHVNERKRKSSTNANSKDNAKKRKANEKTNASSVPCSTRSVTNKSNQTASISRNEKQTIWQERKKRLQEISCKETALKQSESKANNTGAKFPTKPKVKISNSRGLFLTVSEQNEPEKMKYTIPKIKPKLRSGIENTGRKPSTFIPGRKRVTFKETPEIRINSIDEGNLSKRLSAKDAPLPQQRTPPLTQQIICPPDHVILPDILRWVPIWLEEQKNSTLAPDLSGRRRSQMLQTFISAADYYNKVIPLLLLELWQSIFRDWLHINNPVVLACVDKIEPLRSGNGNMLILHCNTVLTKQQHECQNCPNLGDLVIVEVVLNDGKKVSKKFGYVKDMYKRRLVQQDLIHKNLLEALTAMPHYRVRFTMITREFTGKINNDKPVRVRSVSRIGPSLRLFKSVLCLSESPLCKLILKPNVDDYKIPIITDAAMQNTDNLDEKQIQCVQEACRICTADEPKIYMIQGPPGTGKTLVINNIIRQLLYGRYKQRSVQKSCILVCAPSNGAIDELTIKLLAMRHTYPQKERFKMIRMGPPNSIHPIVKDISIPTLVQRHIKTLMQRDLQENAGLKDNLDFCESKINMLKNKIASLKDRQDSLESLKETELQLNKAKASLELFRTRGLQEWTYRERSQKEYEYELQLIENADIICTTLSSCMSSKIADLHSKGKLRFRCCIVDEATQSNEQDTLIPLMLGITKLILVGDPAQLPATVLSQEAKGLGYGTSLFSRIQACLEHLPENPIRLLRTQYRMHAQICKFPNEQFYNNKLITSALLTNRNNSDLHPYRLFGLNTAVIYGENEYLNESEGNFVSNLTDIILKRTTFNIGIITPYSRQKHYLLGQFNKLPESVKSRLAVNTVDGFQGQERDVIILSCVRYNSNIFLADPQRLNVSLTRAKHAIFVCAHAQLFTMSLAPLTLKHVAMIGPKCLALKNYAIDCVLSYGLPLSIKTGAMNKA